MTPSDRDARRLLIDALTNQGTSLARAGKFSDATHAFRRAVELDPADIIARHNLAMALYDSGDIDGALREARRTLTSDSRHAASYDLVGRVLAQQGRYDDAVQQLQRALQLVPDDVEIQNDLREVLAVRSASTRSRQPVR